MKFSGGVKWYCGRQGWSYEGVCAAECAASHGANASPIDNDNKVFFICTRQSERVSEEYNAGLKDVA